MKLSLVLYYLILGLEKNRICQKRMWPILLFVTLFSLGGGGRGGGAKGGGGGVS